MVRRSGRRCPDRLVTHRPSRRREIAPDTVKMSRGRSRVRCAASGEQSVARQAQADSDSLLIRISPPGIGGPPRDSGPSRPRSRRPRAACAVASSPDARPASRPARGRTSSRSSSSAGMYSDRRKTFTMSIGPAAAGGAEIGMDRLAQGHAAGRVDRDDRVAGALEVCGHSVAGSLRLSAQSHHGDAPGGSQDLASRSVRRHRLRRSVALGVPLTARPTRIMPLRRAISTARVEGPRAWRRMPVPPGRP